MIFKLLNFDFLVLVFLFGICIYLYFYYDRYNKNDSNIDLDSLDLFFTKRGETKYKQYGKYENECRRIFENIFNEKFPSKRPSFLKNPVTKQNLELDGFCDRLNLAFEYDGSQHSQYNPHFHKGGSKEFIYQVKKDEFKNLKCKENGITLIRIPHNIKFDSLQDYILQKLRDRNII